MPKKVKINAKIKNKKISLDGSKEIIYERDFYLPDKVI